MAEPKKITIMHSETKEKKVLSSAQFKAWMMNAPDAKMWMVSETEFMDNNTPLATQELTKRLGDLGELLERERRAHGGWTLRVLTAALGGHKPCFPTGVTAGMVIDTATEIIAHTKGFPDAIKAACKVHGVTKDFHISDDYRDEWE